MFRNTPFANTPTFKLILGFGLCTLGGAMMYAYFKTRDDEEDEQQKKNTKSQATKNGPGALRTPASSSSSAAQAKVAKAKEITVKLEISNQHVPLIVGRNGVNLSLIEEKSSTKIQFREKNDSQQYCEITGDPEAVKKARELLLKEIERSPIVKEDMYVPQRVCSKQVLQEICRVSMAKISSDSGRSASMDKKHITIVGNRQQVNIARKLIEDKVGEEEDLQRSVHEVEQKREPRRSPTNSMTSSLYSSQTSLSSHMPPREKLMAAKGDEKPLEVYVSAVATPTKFWVQLVGPQSKKLDDMVDEMCTYYGVEANRENHRIREPYLGQIVAAMFKYDGKWYRAEIVGILPNQYQAGDVVLDLYFVDYGDSEYVTPHEVFELRTDFLTLRFQAVECFLANVKSTNLAQPEHWDAQAIEKFEEITQVAHWKKLISRVVTYKDRPKPIVEGDAPDVDPTKVSTQRESSPIPGVELFDPTEGVEVNLGHVLISHGFALPLDEHYPRARSPQLAHRIGSGHSSPESSLYQSLGSPTINNAATTEDAVMAQQLEHLALKNNNLYLKENGDVPSSHPLPVALSTTCASVSGGSESSPLTNGKSSTHLQQHELTANGDLNR